MAGNSPIPYRLIERALRRGGARFDGSTGSHFKWTFRGRPFAIPVHHKQVKAAYVRRLRDFWQLAQDDGISDHDFWQGQWISR